MAIKSERQIISTYLSSIGRRGGKKSKRALTSDDARHMVQVRIAKKAFRDYYTECFWSFDPELIITKDDVAWVAKQLMKNGSRKCWELGRSLCQ
jgi:hypothetical protein